MNKKVVVITGPTASGKTKIAIQLAKKINAEIICADSRIVYKDFDIVSAKPTIDEREGVCHHLIDITDANSEFSAADFADMAQDILKKILPSGKNVIIAGGTWFYIKSLLDNQLLPNCPIDSVLRERLSKYDSIDLWEKLKLIDSKRAEAIHPNNKDKIIRAIEMCETLKMPVSEYRRLENKKYDALWYMPNFEREILYERINQRVDEMIDMGLYSEWEENKEKYSFSKVFENTIGYAEFSDLKKGIYSNFDEAVDKIKQHTRNFAKRQLTYFNSRKDIKFINGFEQILEDFENV